MTRWVVRKADVDKWLVATVYEAETLSRTAAEDSDGLSVKVGLHQACSLEPIADGDSYTLLEEFSYIYKMCCQ